MRRAVFLDRDGVINSKPAPHDYIRSWGQFELIPAIADWIRLFNALELLVIVITNQRGVARGLVSAAALDDIHTRMKQTLEEQGARIDDIFCCPHEENTCECRKPKPGLILAAQRKWGIDLERSLYLGDSDDDRLLAESCGIPFLRVENGACHEPDLDHCSDA